MNDLQGAFATLAQRGSPVGSEVLRQRVALDLARKPVRRLTLPSPASLRGPAIALAAAAITLLLVGLALLVAQLASDEPPVVTEPTVVTTVPPTPTTLPESPPPDAAPRILVPGSWERVGTTVMQPIVGLFDMTLTEDKLVAIGFDPGENFRQDGVILVSEDGINWTRLGADDPSLTLGAVLMYGVNEGGPGLVAVGMGCENEEEGCGPYATVWTSADGTSWTRSPLDTAVFGDPETQSSAMFDVLETQDGLLVATGDLADWVVDEQGEIQLITPRPVVWTSSDGVTWERSFEGESFDLDLDAFMVATVSMPAVAEGPGGRVVGAGATLDGTGQSVAALWTSEDGTEWSRVPHDLGLFPQGSQILDIAAGASGFVAVGLEIPEDTPPRPAVWVSPDGTTWTRATFDVDTSEYSGGFSAVAALESGFAAVGPHGFADEGEGPVTVWTSPDGLSWDRVLVMGGGYAQAMVATDTGIVVAGGVPEFNDFHAAVWAGPISDPANPPAVPDVMPAVPGPAPPEPIPEEGTIGGLDEGLACEDLTDFSYAEVVAYWARWEMPANLDTDGNGMPCEDEYPVEDVAAIFGGADALNVQLVPDLEALTFTATGPAVDAGLICPAGTTEFSGDAGTLYETALFRWEDEYTCDDGSGSFILGADEFIETGTHMFGVWNIASGTGAYESLRGGGGVGSEFGITDISIGRVYLAEPDG